MGHKTADRAIQIKSNADLKRVFGALQTRGDDFRSIVTGKGT